VSSIRKFQSDKGGLYWQLQGSRRHHAGGLIELCEAWQALAIFKVTICDLKDASH